MHLVGFYFNTKNRALPEHYLAHALIILALAREVTLRKMLVCV